VLFVKCISVNKSRSSVFIFYDFAFYSIVLSPHEEGMWNSSLVFVSGKLQVRTKHFGELSISVRQCLLSKKCAKYLFFRIRFGSNNLYLFRHPSMAEEARRQHKNITLFTYEDAQEEIAKNSGIDFSSGNGFYSVSICLFAEFQIQMYVSVDVLFLQFSWVFQLLFCFDIIIIQCICSAPIIYWTYVHSKSHSL